MEKETLYRFFRGEASPEEERRLMEWLDADAENRRTFDCERALFTALQLFAPRPKARARVSESRPGRRSGVLRRLAVPALRIAAVVALAVGISWGVISHRERNWEQLTNRIVVPAGQRINLTLQDGTSVWLNAGTRLEYPALFADGERRVHIDGEARFDVRHDADRPFVVETYACDVRVLGTEFDVAADSLRRSFSTALFEGSVEVRNRQTSETVRLRPDQTVRLEGSRLAVGSIENSDDYLWTEGYINFKGHTFREIIDRYRQVYGVEIRLDGVEVPDTRFQWGKIHIQDGVDNAMKVLQHTYPIRYEFDPERRTVIVRNR